MMAATRVLVLAAAGEKKVKRVVADEIRCGQGRAVMVGVRQLDAWRYEGLGCNVLSSGEEGTSPEGLAGCLDAAGGTSCQLVIPIGFPRQGFEQLLGLLWRNADVPVRVEGWGGLRITGRRLALAFLGVVFVLLHVPARLALRAIRVLDGAGLLLLQLAARARQSRRSPGGRSGGFTCQVINSLATGGAQRQLVEYLRLCHDRGKRVHLLLLHRDPGYLEEDLPSAGIAVEVLQDRLEALPFGRLLAAAMPRVALVVALWARLRELRPDCVWSWLFLANVVSTTAGRLAGVPRLVASVRNTSDWKTWPQYRHWWLRPADHNAAVLADVTVVNAQTLLANHASWARVPESRLVFIPNGVNHARFLSSPWRSVRSELGLPQGIPVVLSVGRLSPQKDYPLLLRAAAQLKAEGVQYRLVVLGEGALLAELHKLAHELGVAEWVRFPGGSAEPQSFYRSADVFALSSRFEGMPNALMEAQLFGLPAVTTAAGGAGEVVLDGRTGFVVETGDEGAFAAALARLLRDAPLRQRLGREAQRLIIERFSWDRVAAQMDALAEVDSRAG